MDILFVSNLFPDEDEPWRGLDNATLLLGLRDLDASLRIRVLAFRPSIKHFGHAPKRPRSQDACFHPNYFWTPYIPKMGGWNHKWFAHAFSRAYQTLPKGFEPQAILSAWLFPDACGVSMVASKAQVPVVAIAQGSDAHHYLEMPMRRRAIIAMTKRVRAVVTRSRDLAERLNRNGADSGVAQTIYNGVDVRTFLPKNRSEACAALGLKSDEQWLLFVGNFLLVKDVPLLLTAFARVVAKSANVVKLALIGGGPLESTIRGLVEQLQIDHRVVFLGRQSAPEVACWMQASHAVCLTSRNEGVPNVVLEAMSCGRVPVCIDVGGIAEVVEPVLGNHFLVQSRDPEAYASALMDILSGAPDSDELHRSMKSYSWENCARKYLELLRGHDRC
ncbi:MAG: glycosyltransferase [Prosthecobacter sp.]